MANKPTSAALPLRLPACFMNAKVKLLAQTKSLNQRAMAVNALALEIVQQLAALAYEHQQTAAGVVILCVRLEVLGQG